MKLLALNCPNLDLSYFTKRGLPIEITHKTINEKFPLKYLYETKDQFNNTVSLYTPDVNAYLEANYKKYEYSIILVGYNSQDYGNELKNTGGYTYFNPLSSGTFWATVRDSRNDFAVHELHHCLCNIINIRFGDRLPKDFMDASPVSVMENGVMVTKWLPYFKDEQPEAIDGNHALTWNNIKKFLPQLLAITYGYKYFSQKEVDKWKLKPELWEKLDIIRGECQFPISITSGLRSKAQNDALQDSASDSSHLSGLACDIACNDSLKRFKLIQVALKNGITRIGLGKDFVHIDISKDKTQNVIWHYYK